MSKPHKLSPARKNNKIPLYILTGFLGSGKTTLLNGLLQQAGMQHTAVIINEFGEIAIDHLLVEKRDERMQVIAGNCLCCTVRYDLLEALDDLFKQRRQQEQPFERLIIETSGIADPAPILRTLQNHPNYQLCEVITTVDAIHAQTQLQDLDESVQQAALASHLLISKVDQVSDEKYQAVAKSLRQLNPSARILACNFNQKIPAASELFSAELPVETWQLVAQMPSSLGHARHRYIQSFCLEHDAPLSWQVLDRWLQQMTRLRGRDLLRVKGIAYTQETDLPVLIQGVQHIFQKPVTLKAWPLAKPRTQIVFITRNLPLDLLKRSLELLIESKTPEQICAAALLFLQGMESPPQ